MVGYMSTGSGSFTYRYYLLGRNRDRLDFRGGDNNNTILIKSGRYTAQEINTQAAKGGFQFKKIRFPRYNKLGFYIKCYTVRRKSRCFCAGNEQRCL